MATKTDPALIWRPLSEHGTQPPITPRQWIVHTAVDGPGPTNLGNYFENATSLESHTWLRWDRHEQLMDFDRQADANYKANRFLKGGIFYGAISTETEDDGSPVMRPWNSYQVAELVRFGVWLNRTYGIPARLCRQWDDTGMGWHAMFPMVWSNARGKTCPGSTRIRQFTEVVLPAIQAVLNEGEEDMSQADVDAIKAEQRRQAGRIDSIYEAVVGSDQPDKGAANPRGNSIVTLVRAIVTETLSGSEKDPNSRKSILRRIFDEHQVDPPAPA